MQTKIIDKISTYSTTKVILWGSFFILISSIVLVYLFTMIFHEEYTSLLFVFSILLPLSIAPLTLWLIVRMSYKLVHIQEHLEEEIAKRQEQEILLFEKARFILMGEMMANISHQWKQPLNTINLAIINLKLQDQYKANEQKNLDIIEQNTVFLAETINDFSSFFDKRTHNEMKNFTQIIKEVESIVGISLQNVSTNLTVENKLSKDIFFAASLIQVILNLLNNAKDACLQQDRKEVKLVLCSNSDSEVELYCYDTGEGVLEENREKIFMPYFTTKFLQTGTGLGLYMSREIVKKIFRGDLQLVNQNSMLEDGYNTCFVLKIPLSTMCTFQKADI
ncbi:sensor histidine kinase [Sulfurimonas sp.]|uniref:sensor histidine kinase n=1 Tax=Sulfurimonas sp. TaxID=2022749 RepID=UPI003D13B3E3